MSIAGFDPSGGAGTLADCKTFEQLKVYGFAVLTANTFQTDNEVTRVDWMPIVSILEQIGLLMDKFSISNFKIGIVKDGEMLRSIVDFLLAKNPKAHVTWDPVLAASSGHAFFQGEISTVDLIRGIKLITPNKQEFEVLFETNEKALTFSDKTMIYLKGGHNLDNIGRDQLFWKRKIYPFRPKGTHLTTKHGSGCVMAAALTAHIARQLPPVKACLQSKRYMESVLSSNQTLLAYHHR